MTEHPYRLVGRLKNNRLWEAILMRYPETRSQADAARRLKTTQGEIGNLLNMSEFPYNYRLHRYTPLALRLAEQLAYPADWLFDPELYGRPPLRIDVPISPKMLPAVTARLALPAAQDKNLMRAEAKAMLARGLHRLTPRERRIIVLRYGLEGEDEHTRLDVAHAFAVSEPRIQQIEQTAMRRLRWYFYQANKMISTRELLP